jgi:hypothetical protein
MFYLQNRDSSPVDGLHSISLRPPTGRHILAGYLHSGGSLIFRPYCECLRGQEGETQGGNKERVRSLPSGDLVEPAANGVEPAANGVEPAANGEGVDESYTALIRVSMIRSSVHSTAMDCNSLRGRG